MTSTPAGAVADGFARMWTDLEPIGRDRRSGGYRRFAWSAADHHVREWFAGEAARRGLEVTEDRVGNQWAWWGDPDAAVAAGRPGVVTGSHLDSVPDGGAFDGPLGVVSAFAAVDLLRAKGIAPTRPIGIANFVDEEGARFGVALAGSRLLTGIMAPERAHRLTDDAGTTWAEAFTATGRDPGGIGRGEETLRRIGAYLELHVEQGKALAHLDAPVAIGTDIWPHGRWRIDLPGQANHAGTTTMADRRDAMVALAGVVHAARESATARGCVATIGKVRLTPGGVNAIPSHATAWLDARGADPEAVLAVVADIAALAATTGGEITEESWTPVTPFTPALVSRLHAVLGGIPLLGTGAGHDAGVLAQAGIPSAMLFVRNPTGVSHSPAEWADQADCLAGVSALATALTHLSQEA